MTAITLLLCSYSYILRPAVVRYHKGEFYHEHYDNRADGPLTRAATILVYLCDTEEGGATRCVTALEVIDPALPGVLSQTSACRGQVRSPCSVCLAHSKVPCLSAACLWVQLLPCCDWVRQGRRGRCQGAAPKGHSGAWWAGCEGLPCAGTRPGILVSVCRVAPWTRCVRVCWVAGGRLYRLQRR